MDQLVPIRDLNGGSTSLGVEPVSDGGIDSQPLAADMDDEDAAEQEAEERARLSIQSCASLDEDHPLYERIMQDIPYGRLRQSGVVCELTDGTKLVTYTYNDLVPTSERRYLRHAVARVDSGNVPMAVQGFYCHTSPRGTPVQEMEVRNGDELYLTCAFADAGRHVERKIVLRLSEGLDVLERETVFSAVNKQSYADPSIGDFERDYCIPLDRMSPRGASTGSFCMTRNGHRIYIIPESSDGTFRAEKGDLTSAVITTINDNVCNGDHFDHADAIGVFGSALDVYCSRGLGNSYHYRIVRMDLRNGESETLFDSRGELTSSEN